MKRIIFNSLFIVVKVEQKLLHCTLVHEGQRSPRELDLREIFRESGKYRRSQHGSNGNYFRAQMENEVYRRWKQRGI